MALISAALDARAKTIVTGLLDAARIRWAPDPDAELVVHDPSMFVDWILRGSVGMGESYMAKKWDAKHLDDVLYRLQSLPSSEKRRLFKSWSTYVTVLGARLTNPQSRRGSRLVAERHYDLGNDFFEAWLDPRMIYTCAYWKTAQDLAEAQEAKLRLIGDKLKLAPGMRVLDIGSGWGGLADFFADRYGVRVTGINISREQLRFASTRYGREGVEFLHCDYRDMLRRFGPRSFDRIVSVGMLEAVGRLNYGRFMSEAHAVLRDGGLALLHTIGGNRSVIRHPDEWITKYIFPGGMLPSASQLSRAMEGLFVLEDWHNFGPDYDRTLLAWHARFRSFVDNRDHGLSDTFIRMWEYYLLLCAAAFRARAVQLWQIVVSKRVPRYESIR